MINCSGTRAQSAANASERSSCLRAVPASSLPPSLSHSLPPFLVAPCAFSRPDQHFNNLFAASLVSCLPLPSLLSHVCVCVYVCWCVRVGVRLSVCHFYLFGRTLRCRCLILSFSFSKLIRCFCFIYFASKLASPVDPPPHPPLTTPT